MMPVADDWKTEVLTNFSQWLEELKAPLATIAPTEKPWDMHTVVAELLALKQHVQLQNREQARLIRALGQATEQAETALDTWREGAKVHAERVADAEQNCARALFPMREALCRGKAAAIAVGQEKSFWRRAPTGLAGIVEGYDLALQRLDHTLARWNIQPVDPFGLPFDPHTMMARGHRDSQDADDNIVVEVLQCGFVTGDHLLQHAEVIVCRKQAA
jgi:molecular chaperone GrpE (heat shock protein)